MINVDSLRWWVLAGVIVVFIGWKIWKDPKWFGKTLSSILGERGEGMRAKRKEDSKHANSQEEEDDVVDTIVYRGQEYEIDWKNRRFLKVWQDPVTKEFKSMSVKLPYHIWDEVFGEDEEEEDEYEE